MDMVPMTAFPPVISGAFELSWTLQISPVLVVPVPLGMNCLVAPGESGLKVGESVTPGCGLIVICGRAVLLFWVVVCWAVRGCAQVVWFGARFGHSGWHGALLARSPARSGGRRSLCGCW